MAKEKIMKERGELLKEEGDVVREYKAMHEDDFWSSWLREDEKSEEESKVEAEEMAWAPPRNMSNWPDWKSTEESECSLEPEGEMRRCQRSLSCRMRSKALTWTLMAKAAAAEERSFGREKRSTRRRG